MLKDAPQRNLMRIKKANPEWIPDHLPAKEMRAHNFKGMCLQKSNPEWPPENLVEKEKGNNELKLNLGGLMSKTTLKGMMYMKVGQIPV